MKITVNKVMKITVNKGMIENDGLMHVKGNINKMYKRHVTLQGI